MMNDEVNAIMAPLNDLKVSFKESPLVQFSEILVVLYYYGLTTQNDSAVE